MSSCNYGLNENQWINKSEYSTISWHQSLKRSWHLAHVWNNSRSKFISNYLKIQRWFQCISNRPPRESITYCHSISTIDDIYAAILWLTCRWHCDFSLISVFLWCRFSKFSLVLRSYFLQAQTFKFDILASSAIAFFYKHLLLNS